jgi:hypothetical protein
MEYLNFWAGEITPIWGKNAGLFALLRIVKISNYSTPSLAPFTVVQYSASLNHTTTN